MGQTGSGKTTLARYLLLSRKYRIVADYKGRIDWTEYRICRTLKELKKRKEPALIYRPDYVGEAQDENAKNQFWEFIYRRGHTTAYIDELTSIATGDDYPEYYGACLVRGRELGVETWSATQRPTRIPQIAASESEHYYAFKLKLPQDRERVEGWSGIERGNIAGLQKRQFIYSRQDSSPVGPLFLHSSQLART